MKYADPMVLRGLLYQLTGDESVAATQATTADARDSDPDSASKDFALVQAKADLAKLEAEVPYLLGHAKVKFKPRRNVSSSRRKGISSGAP